jgi:hypothetical protein
MAPVTDGSHRPTDFPNEEAPNAEYFGRRLGLCGATTWTQMFLFCMVLVTDRALSSRQKSTC